MNKKEIDIKRKGYMFDAVNQHFDTHSSLSEEKWTDFIMRGYKAYPDEA